MSAGNPAAPAKAPATIRYISSGNIQLHQDVDVEQGITGSSLCYGDGIRSASSPLEGDVRPQTPPSETLSQSPFPRQWKTRSEVFEKRKSISEPVDSLSASVRSNSVGGEVKNEVASCTTQQVAQASNTDTGMPVDGVGGGIKSSPSRQPESRVSVDLNAEEYTGAREEDWDCFLAYKVSYPIIVSPRGPVVCGIILNGVALHVEQVIIRFRYSAGLTWALCAWQADPDRFRFGERPLHGAA